MTVNEEKNQIKFDGIIEFFDGNSLKLVAENAVLSDDLSIGIINAAQVLLDDTIRLRAEKIELSNSTIERAENIDRITSCEECESGVPFGTLQPVRQRTIFKTKILFTEMLR